MAESAVAVPRPPSPVRRRRRRWLRLWVIAPALFLVILAVARVVYWRASIHYDPLRPHGAPSPAVGQPLNAKQTASDLVLTGPAGTEQLVEFPLENEGNDPLDINRVTSEDDAVLEVRWAANQMQDGVRRPSPSHPLPVHVPSHAIVNLQLVLEKPACPPGGSRYLDGRVTIHWHAMISPHVKQLDLLRTQPIAIRLCGPR